MVDAGVPEALQTPTTPQSGANLLGVGDGSAASVVELLPLAEPIENAIESVNIDLQRWRRWRRWRWWRWRAETAN